MSLGRRCSHPPLNRIRPNPPHPALHLSHHRIPLQASPIMTRLQHSQVHIRLLDRRPQHHHYFNRNILPNFRDPNLHSLLPILLLSCLRLRHGSPHLFRTCRFLIPVLRYSISLHLFSRRPMLLKLKPTHHVKATVHRLRMIGILPLRCLMIMENYRVPMS